MGPYQSLSVIMDYNGSLKVLVGPYAFSCVLMSTYRFFCVLTGSNGVLWVVIGLYSFLCIPMCNVAYVFLFILGFEHSLFCI